MKTSAIRARLAAKRKPTPSLEQGDISIVVNQDGEQSTDGIDINASNPPDLSAPDLSIADQPEVDEVVDINETDQAGTLDEGNLEGAAQEADQAINEGEDAIEALESYLGHIRQLRQAKMPVSAATVEALHIGIESAMGRWNLKAVELGLPSVESVQLSPQASLESMEREVIASMEGVMDTINDFVMRNGEKIMQLFVGVKRNISKQNDRLKAIRGTASSLTAVTSLPPITDEDPIVDIQYVALDAKNSAAVLKNIQAVSDGLVSTFTSRADTVKAATDKLIKSVLEAETANGDGAGLNAKYSDEFLKDVTNVLFADDKAIKFWIACKPATMAVWSAFSAPFAAAGAMAGAVVAGGVGATVGANAVAMGPLTVSLLRAYNDRVTYKVPSLFRETKGYSFDKPRVKELPRLIPSDAVKAIDSVSRSLDEALRYQSDFGKNSKDLQDIVSGKMKTAASQSGEKSGNMMEVRSMVRVMYNIESAILKGVRYSTPQLVDYIVDCVKAAEKASKGGEVTGEQDGY